MPELTKISEIVLKYLWRSPHLFRQN